MRECSRGRGAAAVGRNGEGGRVKKNRRGGRGSWGVDEKRSEKMVGTDGEEGGWGKERVDGADEGKDEWTRPKASRRGGREQRREDNTDRMYTGRRGGTDRCRSQRYADRSVKRYA